MSVTSLKPDGTLRGRQPVLLRWQAANSFGWGILGLNLLQQWAADPVIQPLMGVPIESTAIAGLDPLRLRAIDAAAAVSNRFAAELSRGEVDLRRRSVLVVEPLGNELTCLTPRLNGLRNVGRCIIENTRIGPEARELQRFDTLLCASAWSAALLRAISDRPVAMIHEGIDHTQFFPGPRAGVLDAGRFYVFSGGKIEYRKGQDLVLLAFREFAARHEDAVLVVTWNSPWPQLSAGFQGKLRAPLRQDAAGALEITRWAVENGIPPRQFIEMPLMPNSMLPMVLREMDCAVQVSRCEACTNLPAKEAMACGVPVILADNTGTRDIVDADNCIALRADGAVSPEPGWGTDGWGEARVDDIVDALERIYTDTKLRRGIGARGASWIIERQRTWRDHAAALKAHLLSLL
jgi:glycosyltransferase involved in cell wall biosynthesis